MSKGRNRRDKAVKQQYEDFPYPPRNPEDEKKRLIVGSPSNLNELNHYLFAGKADFSGPFRALVAGGGTGDAAICLAQQLADQGNKASVTYLDLSKASRKVVEERAKVRGLSNMTFYTGSLLDLPSMGLEPFDYIDCCGVLHHLEDPEEGLGALTSVLNEEGGLGLMLYATLGRTGVYHVQDALKVLYGDDPLARQVRQSKKLVENLPSTNWLVRNPFVGDHKMGEDAAFFDLLLHPRDRSYLVEEIVEFLASRNLGVTGFIEPVNYDPVLYIKEETALKRIKKMDMTEKAALAEKIKGNIKTHVFYAKKKEYLSTSVAKIAPHMVPLLQHEKPAREFASGLKGLKALNVSFDGQNVSFPLPPRCSEIVALMDGKRCLSDIQNELSLNWESFRKLFAPLFKLFNDLNILWLRER
ncbi:MAG: class I SAM-dependent methyltransferase [Sneathiellales bacterium]|nr:class I SAM-dependent methyltransferase [Sneathiellales bacterium]